MQPAENSHSHPEYTYSTFTSQFLHDCRRTRDCYDCDAIHKTIRRLEMEIDTLISKMRTQILQTHSMNYSCVDKIQQILVQINKLKKMVSMNI